MAEPKTLFEVIVAFSDEDKNHEFLVSRRWKNGVTCAHCGSSKVGKISGRRKIVNCKGCKKQFSVRVGTIFEDSALPLSKWFVAIWMISNAKNGISSYELARAIGVTQRSAWFLAHRIRRMLETGSIEKMTGVVEIDETYIGGKARFMHVQSKLRRGITGTGMVGKTPVMGFLNRAKNEGDVSQVHAEVLPSTNKVEMLTRINKYVDRTAIVCTDSLNHYTGLKGAYDHRTVDHKIGYVLGETHTNSLENFWNLLKRSLHGTYTFCLPRHLPKYVVEHVFRFNRRKQSDADRFAAALSCLNRPKLSYRELTGGLIT